MTLLTEKAILFLEEEGFHSVINFGKITFFTKNITDYISIKVNESSVFLSVTSKLNYAEKQNYYFDEIEDFKILKLVVNQLQTNSDKLIISYKSVSFEFLNETEKFLSKSDVRNSIEFVFNSPKNEFVDDNGITISFDHKNKLYSDELGFAMYKKMPF